MYPKAFRMAALIVTTLIVACAPAANAPTAGTAEDETAIRAQVTAYANAYSARDAAALAAITTDDYEAVNPDGSRVNGRSGVEQMVAAEMAMMPADVPMTVTATTDYFRWLSADAAVAGGTWSSMGAPAGMGPDRGAWMSVFRRDTDGQWRMSHGMSAPYMPPPPAPATAQ